MSSSSSDFNRRKHWSKYLLLAANAALASSLLLGGTGCADSLSYAKDARRDGMSLYNEGNYTEATAAFNNATRQDPRDYRSYYYLGACYQAEHQYQQATEAYRSCLDVMPLTLDGKNDVPFRYRVIDSLATAISKGATHGVETVALEQKCAGKAAVEDQWLLAKVYRYTGDADAAIDAYNKAVLIAPNHFAITKEAGLYEQSLGQNERATFALKKAYAINANDEQVNDGLRWLGVVVASNSSRSSSSSSDWNSGRSSTAAPAEMPTVQTPRD